MARVSCRLVLHLVAILCCVRFQTQAVCLPLPWDQVGPNGESDFRTQRFADVHAALSLQKSSYPAIPLHVELASVSEQSHMQLIVSSALQLADSTGVAWPSVVSRCLLLCGGSRSRRSNSPRDRLFVPLSLPWPCRTPLVNLCALRFSTLRSFSLSLSILDHCRKWQA